MKKGHPNKPARPGRGHGKERGRLFYILWGVGIIGFFGFPYWLELTSIWSMRLIYYPSALMGDADSQYELGRSYYGSGFFVRGDPEQGFYWDQRAANQGHISAMKMVAHSYLTGSGVEHDLNNAIIWYGKAAVLGDPNAKIKLEEVIKSLPITE
jgi:TPR repeat protein